MAFIVNVNDTQVHIKAGLISMRKLRMILREMEINTKLNAAGGPYSRTGRLVQSIGSRGPTIQGFSTVGTVGSRLHYAKIVDRGAKVHPIFPKGAPHIYYFNGHLRGRGPRLKFVWHGRLIYTPHVPMAQTTVGISHPGQRGKFFLEQAATFIATKYKMRLIIH